MHFNLTNSLCLTLSLSSLSHATSPIASIIKPVNPPTHLKFVPNHLSLSSPFPHPTAMTSDSSSPSPITSSSPPSPTTSSAPPSPPTPSATTITITDYYPLAAAKIAIVTVTKTKTKIKMTTTGVTVTKERYKTLTQIKTVVMSGGKAVETKYSPATGGGEASYGKKLRLLSALAGALLAIFTIVCL